MGVTVTLKQCAKLVRRAIDRNIPVMLWGAPGIGKTDLAAQIAAAIGLPLVSFIASLKSLVDLSGVPVADLANGKAVWLRPEDFPSYPCLLFIDEINTCAPAMQAGLMQLVLERRCGTHQLHPDTIVIAAGNRITDRAAAQRMPTALRNRFSHLTVIPDVEAWSEWASAEGIDPLLVAFLNFRRNLLHVMPGQTIDDGDMKVSLDAEANAFPTPRSWCQAGKFLDLPADERLPLVASQVGEGPAAELEGFLRVCQHVPTLEDVVRAPATAKVPPQGDAASRYAIVAMLCRCATRQNFDAVMEYAARLGREYEVLTAVDAVRRHPDLANTSAFGTWAVSNQEVVL